MQERFGKKNKRSGTERMKNRIKKGVSVLLMIVVLIVAVCPNVASAAKVKLNKTSLTLTKGKSYTLKVKGTSKKVTWKSSKKSVASVSQKGRVTAKKTGKTTVVATVAKKKYSCKVTVKAKKDTTTKVTAEPTIKPTVEPTVKPTEKPTEKPTAEPTEQPTEKPTDKPTAEPTVKPTEKPTVKPTMEPTIQPTVEPNKAPVTGIKCYNVQDTNLDETEGSGGKGDASIIDCGNKEYVMIDCGSEADYNHLRARMLKTCDKSYRSEYDGEKIYIPLLIISHNHKDHMGAIKNLLNDSEIYVKEVIYTYVGPDGNSSEVATCGAEIMTKLVSKAQVQKGTNDGYDYKATRSVCNTKITIYGPATKFQNHRTEELAANNSSMVVKVEGSMKAIFLGDLCYDGLEASKEAYMAEGLFTGDYDFCKFGHHGYRTASYCYKDGTLINGEDSEKEGTFSKEIRIYNQYINAKEYVFTASKKRLTGECTNDIDIKYNYLALIKYLKHRNNPEDEEEEGTKPQFHIGTATVGNWSSVGSEE